MLTQDNKKKEKIMSKPLWKRIQNNRKITSAVRYALQTKGDVTREVSLEPWKDEMIGVQKRLCTYLGMRSVPMYLNKGLDTVEDLIRLHNLHLRAKKLGITTICL